MTRDEADAVLRSAIEQHAVAFELHRDDELLSEFAVVANWQKIESDGNSRYTTHFHQETIPNHIAVGLFDIGRQLAIDPYEVES